MISCWIGGLALLICSGLAIPAGAQVAEPGDSQPGPAAADLTELAILEACAEDRAGTLPNPFPDVQPTDWAYEAVLTLYYCGAYRGAIPPEQYKDYLDSQAPQQS